MTLWASPPEEEEEEEEEEAWCGRGRVGWGGVGEVLKEGGRLSALGGAPGPCHWLEAEVLAEVSQ